MTTLVVGASGLVGSHLVESLRRDGEEVVGTFLRHPAAGQLPLDLRDGDAVRRCVESCRPEIIYLPASLTHVDHCETHPEESFATNVSGVRHLVSAAAARRARVVYFSSDYVFTGDAGPYAETDPVGPLSVYGRHKVLAEQSLPADALIIRTTVVYGREEQAKNFVYRLRERLSAGREILVPADQLGNPTYAPNLVRASAALARAGAAGIYHVAGRDRISRYEFALEVARIFSLPGEHIRPVTTDELHQPAPRPLSAGMKLEKAQAELPFPLIGCREGLSLLREEETRQGAQPAGQASA